MQKKKKKGNKERKSSIADFTLYHDFDSNQRGWPDTARSDLPPACLLCRSSEAPLQSSQEVSRSLPQPPPPLSSLHTLSLERVYPTGHTHSHLFLHSDLPSELQTQIPSPGWRHLLNVSIAPQNHHIHTDLSKPSLLEFSLSNNFCVCAVLSRFSCVASVASWQLFVTPWTIARRAPPSMGFSRQEYWSGLPCLPPRGPSQTRDRTCVSRILLCKTSSSPPVPPEKPFCIYGFVTNQTKMYWLGTTTTSPEMEVGGGGHWITLFTFLWPYLVHWPNRVSLILDGNTQGMKHTSFIKHTWLHLFFQFRY